MGSPNMHNGMDDKTNSSQTEPGHTVPTSRTTPSAITPLTHHVFGISFWIPFFSVRLVNLVPANTGRSATLHGVQLIMNQIQKIWFFELFLAVVS
jgi:hypothetical protein